MPFSEGNETYREMTETENIIPVFYRNTRCRSLRMVRCFTSAYTCVVRTLLCPSNACTVVMGTPLLNSRVAKVCRAV